MFPGPRRRDAPRCRSAAARSLFTARGYADTSVSDIAASAGVAVDTVYASVGRKPQLLLAVHDMVLGSADEPVPAQQRDYVRAMQGATGAREKLRIYADALGRLLPRTVPLADALRVAALTDPGCRAVWNGLNERRAQNMRLLAADLRSTGEVREDLTDEDVADLVWSTNSPEFYLLTVSRGRTPEQYADLVRDLWTRTLLA